MICTNCKEPINSACGSYTSFDGGFVAETVHYACDDDTCLGFAHISWKAPPNIGGRKFFVELVDREKAPGGQFECDFCSIKCLREYINGKLDSLERMATAYSTGES